MLTKLTKIIGGATLALGLTLGAAGNAQAGTELAIDVNALEASFDNGPFSTTATGTLNLTDTGITVLNNIQINGVTAAGFSGGLFESFTGVINIVNGIATSGFIEIVASDGTYVANIASNGNQAQEDSSDIFSFSGLTFNGNFTSNTFAGVDVTDWFDHQPLSGRFRTLEYNANSGRADVDIVAVVPTPAAALAGLPLLGVLGIGYAVRRRRMMNAA